MWTIRLILLCVLAAFDCISMYLLKHRSKYKKVSENTLFNALIVIVGHCICYLIVILPPQGGWDKRPSWMQYSTVRIGFPVIGLLLICIGAFLAIASFYQGKALGVQKVKSGLLTTGMYRYFRHPIYTGILWVTMGLPAAMRNPDGLMIFPALFALSVIGTQAEEKHDVRVRFPEQYDKYSKTTKMFGPVWIWGVWILSLTGLAYAGIVMH